MRFILPICFAACLCAADVVPPVRGSDAILDAAIQVTFADPADRELVYKVLADTYSRDADLGIILHRRLSRREGYGQYQLHGDAAVIGLRGDAREKALAAYDAKKTAEEDAKIAELDKELAAQKAAAKTPAP